MLNTPEAIGALCAYRDEKRAEAKRIQELMDKELNSAKAIAHDRKIVINRLNKEADRLQSFITPEMQQKVDEVNKMEDYYSYHIRNEL